MANTLNLGDGNWATKKDSLLAYNSENNNYKPLPFDFSRGSSATVVNKDGLIQTVGSGEPRIDYKDNSKGALLLEPSRTNSILYSNGFDNSSWQKGGGGLAPAPTVNANQGISPDGSNNAYKIVFDLAGGTSSSDRSRLTQAVTGTSSTNYAFSFYAKAFSTSDVGKIVNFSVDNVNNENANFTLTSDWKRFTFLGISDGTNINQHIQLRGNLSTSDSVSMLLFGYQIESNASYPTSYIPTVGSAVTRLADVCNNAGNDQVINSTEGVLYAEISALNEVGTNQSISISNGSLNNRILFRYNGTNQIRVIVISDPSSTFVFDKTVNISSIEEYNKFSIKYKQNDFALWVNGLELGSDNSGLPPVGLSELSFDDGSGANDFYGNIKDIKIYNTALSDQELQALTTI